MKKEWVALCAGGLMACCIAAGEARAASTAMLTGNFQVRVRGVGVLPDDDSTVNIGGETDVSDAYVPELDLTWFFTDKIGAELILATAKHDVDYTGGAFLGDTWILPPTLTLQYHPLRGQGAFSPYMGAGLNYSMFYGEDAGAGFTNLEVEGGLGYALQLGADYWVTDNWGWNVDVKKIFLNIDGKLNNGAIRADIDLDPWIIGTGVSYRF